MTFIFFTKIYNNIINIFKKNVFWIKFHIKLLVISCSFALFITNNQFFFKIYIKILLNIYIYFFFVSDGQKDHNLSIRDSL
jgi:hypothetical protein